MESELSFDKLLPTTQPVYVRSVVYSFGALTLGALVMLVISGVVLAANGPGWWSQPGLGSFTRAVHFWATQAFFFFLLLHLTAQFFMGSWRHGRQATWVVGAVSFGVAVLEGFTGYLSRGDFFSQWNQVQSKDAFNASGLGAWLNVLNSGQIYGLHIAVLGPVLLALVGLHLAQVRRKGVVPPYPARRRVPDAPTELPDKVKLTAKGGSR
ncbi:MAG: cytochrome b N-terminal domain-containing protein [Acidimicrobiales bacterium]